jgi:putative hydrolase of the HAD superfamily
LVSRGILWDFDGTLARRTGFWSDLLVQLLDAESPDHGYQATQFRDAMRTGFPWHDWERPHPDVVTSERWWSELGQVIARVLIEAGIDPAVAQKAAAGAARQYLELERWEVYPDTVPVLTTLRSEGWRHAIVSNHVPELPELVEALGLADLFDAILTSGLTGYEKPHPEAFARGRKALGNPDELWIVGDNPKVDIEGAERAGIRGILVRTSANESGGERDLYAAAEVLRAGHSQTIPPAG